MKESNAPQKQLRRSMAMEKGRYILRLAVTSLLPLLAESMIGKLIEAALNYLSSR